MNTDDLDTKTDDELNELFAVEVAGVKCAHRWRSKSGVSRRGSRFVCEKCGKEVHGGYRARAVDNVVGSADLVLPWLEKWRQGEPDYRRINSALSDAWHVELVGLETEAPYAKASIFARAAVIALIRAKRAEKKA